MGNPIEIDNPISNRIDSIIASLTVYKKNIKDMDIVQYHGNQDFINRNKEIFRSIDNLEDTIDNFLKCSANNDYSFTPEENLQRGRVALITFGYMNAFSS